VTAREKPANEREITASGSAALQEPMGVGVLVVDDQAHFRRVALEVVGATPGFEPLGEAASGEEALALAADLRPELILLDVRMPVMNGIETARRLSTEQPGGVIVLVSIDDPSELPDDMESCGAKAVIRKQDFGSRALRRLWDAQGDPDSRASHGARP
jgi:two-component system, NarL family, invasion response regulator UvrY